MKKLLSMLLCVALVFSFALPTLAVEDFDPPLWEEWGYSSMQEMLDDWYMTEEEYYGLVEEERSYREFVFDEEAGDFVPPYWEQNGYSSLEELLEDWYMTEEEYYELVYDEYMWRQMNSWTDEEWEDYFDEQLLEDKQEMGLIYDVNLIFNDEVLTFTDEVPEIVNGRTMVPLRSVMENLGAEVEYKAAENAAEITAGNITILFPIGGDSATVTVDGKSTELALDSAAYLKNDRVFVPIRFVAEAMGYDVLWDSYYETGVLLDKKAIIASINDEFKAVNSVLAMASSLDLSKTYKTDTVLDIGIKIFDSINGDQKYDCGMDVTVIENDTYSKMTINFDLKGLIALLESYADEADPYLDMMMLVDVLAKVDADTMECIINLDEGMIYFKSNLLWELNEYTDLGIEKGSWIGIDISAYMDEIGEMMEYVAVSENLTIGDLIYVMNTQYAGIYSYNYIANDVEELAVIADSAFTKTGSSYKFAYEDEIIYEYYYGGGEITRIKANVDIATNGKIASRVTGNGEVWQKAPYTGEVLVNWDFSLTALEAKISGSVHLKNNFVVDFKMTSTAKTTAVSIPTAPPAGDNVVMIDELMGPALPY